MKLLYAWDKRALKIQVDKPHSQIGCRGVKGMSDVKRQYINDDPDKGRLSLPDPLELPPGLWRFDFAAEEQMLLKNRALW